MKKNLLALLIASTFILTGCDFLIKPTSESHVSESGVISESESESEPESEYALSVRISGPESILLGEIGTYEAHAYPSNTTIETIRWKISDTSIATINNRTGKIIATKNAMIFFIFQNNDVFGKSHTTASSSASGI